MRRARSPTRGPRSIPTSSCSLSHDLQERLDELAHHPLAALARRERVLAIADRLLEIEVVLDLRLGPAGAQHHSVASLELHRDDVAGQERERLHAAVGA